MSVSLTGQLQDQLLAVGADPKAFANAFAEWKADWPANEYESKLFGKDGAYLAPKVDGELGLRHVHIVPMQCEKSSRRWWKAWRYRSRKTSDRHLVYVEHKGNFLLIYILDEPDAHSVAHMKTPADKALMKKFAIIAEDFIFDGTIP